MAGFSIGEALGAGFRIIGRKPLAPAVWGLVALVVGVVPVLLILGSLAGNLETLAAMKGDPDPEMMSRIMGPMMALNGPIWLLSVVLNAVLMSAVFRAVLEPENDRWFYLRLSGQEFWVGLVYVCQVIIGTILAYVLIGLPVLIAAGAGAVGASAGGGAEAQAMGGAAIGGALGLLVGCAVLLWLLMRFSMALPMSFAERTFRLFESWPFTKGQSFSLFLLCLVIAVIIVAIYAVLGGLAFTLFGLAAGAHVLANADAIEAFFSQSPTTILAAVGPWVIGAVVVFSVIGGYVHAIVYGPWADAYRQLAARRAAVPEA